MSGRLVLLPTALGNAGHWSAVLPADTRASACQLRHFIVENAKTARASLKWMEHPVPLRELAIEQLPDPLTAADIERLLAPLGEGHDIGLMSEAGCPGVADPGALLVRRAHERGITVKPLVGPSSLLLALMASGLDGQRFAFHGYLPQRDPERSQRIQALEKESRLKRQTQLFIETPYRNDALLAALVSTCQPDTLLCLASSLTQGDEQVTTRRIGEWRRLAGAGTSKQPTVFLMLSVR